MTRYDDEFLETFFARYGEALTTGDLPAIAGCYALPALVLSHTEVVYAGGIGLLSPARGPLPTVVARIDRVIDRPESPQFAGLSSVGRTPRSIRAIYF